MSGACDNFILEDQSCEWFELIQYVERFDMGINFLEGPPGPPGPAGEAIFIPFVSQDGWISWTNTAGLPNPDPVYIKGPPGGGGSGDYDDLTDKPSINGVTLSGNKTTADLLIAFSAADVGLGNVANERQYSAQNPPPYPVTSVAGKTGAISLLPSDVGLGNVANERQYSAQNPPPYPVTSVNGQTGDVVISGGGAVDSVNGQTGDVVLDAADVGAIADDYYDTPVTGTITQLQGGGTFDQIACVKFGNFVIAGARFYGGSAAPSNYNGIFQLPAGFRPRADVACSGYVYYDNVSQYALAKVKTNGEVGFNFASAPQSQMGFIAVFMV